MMAATSVMQKPSVKATFSAARPQARPQARMVVRAASIAAEDVPSPEKRGIMNLLLLGAVGAPVRGDVMWITDQGGRIDGVRMNWRGIGKGLWIFK